MSNALTTLIVSAVIGIVIVAFQGQSWVRRIAIWSLIFLPIGPTVSLLVWGGPACFSSHSLNHLSWAPCLIMTIAIGIFGTLGAIFAPSDFHAETTLGFGLLAATAMGIIATALSAWLKRRHSNENIADSR